MTPYDGSQMPAPVTSGFELGDVLRCLWRGKFVIGACVAAITAASVGLAFWMTPVYSASIVIVASNSGRMSGLGATGGSLASLVSMAGVDLGPSGGPQVQEELAVLSSRELSEGFIAEQRLLPEFFPKLWDRSRDNWVDPGAEHPTLFQAYRKFNNLRTIEENRKTGLVTVRIDWTDRDKAAQWANALIERLNEVMRKRAIERTDAHLQYLQREFDSTSAVETRAAISRLMESQINERMLANVTKEYAFRVVDRALVPDARNPERPKKARMIETGAFLGLAVGAAIALVRRPSRRTSDGAAIAST